MEVGKGAVKAKDPTFFGGNNMIQWILHQLLKDLFYYLSSSVVQDRSLLA